MVKTYIIAEIGINHNGDLKLAKRLVKKAKKAGARGGTKGSAEYGN